MCIKGIWSDPVADQHGSTLDGSSMATFLFAVATLAVQGPPVVVLGAGVIGSSIAYHLALRGVAVTLVEQHRPACAASGHSGGFLAGSWGDGTLTERLHRTSFRMHAELAETLGVESYRSIPTLQIQSGTGDLRSSEDRPWLSGPCEQELLDDGEMTAQVDPRELTMKLLEAAQAHGATLRYGEVVGIETEADEGKRRVTGVTVSDRDGAHSVLDCERVVTALGPWSCKLEDWLGLPLPLEGVWSTSLVWKSEDVQQPAALFMKQATK